MAFLENRGTKELYHFRININMDTSWLFNNENIFYLQTEINVTYGKMLIGIQVIDGIKYKFAIKGVIL